MDPICPTCQTPIEDHRATDCLDNWIATLCKWSRDEEGAWRCPHVKRFGRIPISPSRKLDEIIPAIQAWAQEKPERRREVVINLNGQDAWARLEEYPERGLPANYSSALFQTPLALACAQALVKARTAEGED